MSELINLSPTRCLQNLKSINNSIQLGLTVKPVTCGVAKGALLFSESPRETQMTKKKNNKSSFSPKNKKSDVIKVNPSVKGLPENSVAPLTSTNEALNSQQRLRRGAIMRRMQPRLRLAQKIARRRMADQDTLNTRTNKLARRLLKKRFGGTRGFNYAHLGTGEKITIDRMVHNKKKLQKQISVRVYPKVRQAEFIRAGYARKGKYPKISALNIGKLMHSHNRPIDEATKEQVSQRQNGNKNSVRIHDQRALHHAKWAKHFSDNNRPVRAKEHAAASKLHKEAGDAHDKALYSAFKKDHENADHMTKRANDRSAAIYTAYHSTHESLTPNALKSITEKAALHQIPADVLLEVYDRGFKAYDGSNAKLTPEQFAFNRVNSFLQDGKALDEDKDLLEHMVAITRFVLVKLKNGKLALRKITTHKNVPIGRLRKESEEIKEYMSASTKMIAVRRKDGKIEQRKVRTHKDVKEERLIRKIRKTLGLD